MFPSLKVVTSLTATSSSVVVEDGVCDARALESSARVRWASLVGAGTCREVLVIQWLISRSVMSLKWITVTVVWAAENAAHTWGAVTRWVRWSSASERSVLRFLLFLLYGVVSRFTKDDIAWAGRLSVVVNLFGSLSCWPRSSHTFSTVFLILFFSSVSLGSSSFNSRGVKNIVVRVGSLMCSWLCLASLDLGLDYWSLKLSHRSFLVCVHLRVVQGTCRSSSETNMRCISLGSTLSSKLLLLSCWVAAGERELRILDRCLLDGLKWVPHVLSLVVELLHVRLGALDVVGKEPATARAHRRSWSMLVHWLRSLDVCNIISRLFIALFNLHRSVLHHLRHSITSCQVHILLSASTARWSSASLFKSHADFFSLRRRNTSTGNWTRRTGLLDRKHNLLRCWCWWSRSGGVSWFLNFGWKACRCGWSATCSTGSFWNIGLFSSGCFWSGTSWNLRGGLRIHF